MAWRPPTRRLSRSTTVDLRRTPLRRRLVSQTDGRMEVYRVCTGGEGGASAWKQATGFLPAEAKQPGLYGGRGPYPFCLPAEFATLNLLPEARRVALERFHAAKVPWHAGSAGAPSNHLLSSQVQCANALAPFVDDPDSLKR